MTKIEVRLNPDVSPTGSDLGVVNAARRSFNTRSEWEYFKGNGEPLGEHIKNYSRLELEEYFGSTKKLKDKDKRLLEFLARGMTADDFDEFLKSFQVEIGYLDEGELLDKLWEWRNTPVHDTPFNHGFFSFEVKAPIFVRAQLVKHEYLIMSEYSRRYITDDVEFYEHTYREAAENKKQGSGDTHAYSGNWQEVAKSHNQDSLNKYNKMVEDGVAPEQARGMLPQDLMTAWTWSGTLGAFAKMCQLRLHKDAQYEARLVAQGVYKYLKEYFPVSAPLLVEGVK